MKQLKTFINKDVIKRMRHNERGPLYVLWPDSSVGVNRISRNGFTPIETKTGGKVFILDDNDLQKVNKIIENEGLGYDLFQADHTNAVDLTKMVKNMDWKDMNTMFIHLFSVL